jgi:hypothetical protein
MEALTVYCSEPDITWSNQSLATASRSGVNLHWSGQSDGYPVGRLLARPRLGLRALGQSGAENARFWALTGGCQMR